MPVNEFEGNSSWGYNVSFHIAADKYYGTSNKLKEFIDVCHQNGIAVLFDMVLNHAYGQSPLVRMYWDSANNRPAADSPWFNVDSPNQVYSFGYDFNHEKSATKYFVDRVNRYWLEEYKFDGFRFDFTKGFTNTPGDGGAYDLPRINILKRMADQIWDYDSTAYIILEHFAPDNEEIVLSNYGMMLWGNLNYNYNEATMGYHDSNKSNFSRISYLNRGWTKPYLVGYMESHDEERLMYKNLIYGNSSGSYNIKNLNVALNRMKLAVAFFFTVPGPKMIWQFGELGYDISIDSLGRLGEKPVKWNYLDDDRRTNLYKVYSSLIKLKKDYEVFSTDNFTLTVSASIKKINLIHATMDAYIIGNFGVTQLTANQSFTRTGWWYDYFSGDSVNVTSLTENITLEPGDFRIYTTTKLPTPEAGILLDVEQIDDQIPVEFALEQNYPNPFNPNTVIRYSIVSPSLVSLKIFDVLGREVKTLVNKEQVNGVYEVNWNGDDALGNKVSTGVYFYRIDAGDFVQTKKMMLIK
jgi:glycosidase